MSEQLPDAQIAAEEPHNPFAQERKWLASLKAGDEVAMSYGWTGHVISTVERATASQLIIRNARFRRADGYQIGTSGYHRPRIYEPTPAIREDVEKAKLVHLLENTKWKALPIDVLKAAVAAVARRGINV